MGLTFYILMSLLLSGPTLTEEDLGIKDGIDDESLSCRHHSVGIVCLKGLEIMWGGYQLGWAGLGWARLGRGKHGYHNYSLQLLADQSAPTGWGGLPCRQNC